ncbi:MAG: hypothetical protein LBE17_03475, partial [Treponema sp.]|nr:hypothetical protein [Treponema sp.]
MEGSKPVRLCAMRKTEEESDQKSVAKGVEGLKATNRTKSHGKPPSEAQLANNRYIIVMTSLLEVEAALLLEL